MKKQSIFFIFFLIAIRCLSFEKSTPNYQLTPVILCSISNYTLFSAEQQNAVHYVIASSGLSIRKQPDIKAERIDVLPYGTSIKILKETQKELTIQDEGNIIKGHWVYIQSISSSPVEGYVFDGFVSKQNPKRELSLTTGDLLTTNSYGGITDANLEDQISIELLSKTAFLKAKKQFYETQMVFDDTSKIKKTNDQYSLKTARGIVEIKDKITGDVDENIYQYLGTHETLNSYVFSGGEIGEVLYTLVNKKTGIISELPDIPLVSPDRKKIATISSDVFEVAPMVLEIFEVKEKGFEKIISFPSSNIVYFLRSNSIFWKSNSELYLKVVSMKLITEIQSSPASHQYQYIGIKLLK